MNGGQGINRTQYDIRLNSTLPLIMNQGPYNSIVDLNQSVKVVRLDPNTRFPTKGSTNSAGIDLYPSEEVEIQPLETQLIPTKIALQFPYGTFGLLTSRSKTSFGGFLVIPGVIDPDYNKEIYIQVFNKNKNETIKTNLNTPIAQMIPIRFANPVPIELEEFPEKTTRKLAFNLGENKEPPQLPEISKAMYT
jgi:deoxyuridine 5'-triphosphate nucleotidohydrolase